MVKFKPVPSLAECVKKEIPVIVKNHIIRSAYNLNISWYVICAGYSHLSTQEVLTLQMEKFRDYLLANIVWTDREEVFYLLLRGVDEGIMKVRRGWSREKKHDQYMQVMEAVTLFTDIVQFPNLQKLDFGEIPRTIRYRIFQMIPKFTELRVLIIGPGTSGAWIPIKGKSANELSDFVSHLHNLEHFSLKKDCNIKILQALVKACSKRLKVLDVENSNFLQDEAVPLIISCHHLRSLYISGTNISDEGRARIMTGLASSLRDLVRADFLCDALGWVDYLEEVEDPVFHIREFLPSTNYFFHEDWQMEMVARMCPWIQKMLFIHHQKCCPTLQSLEAFQHLTELQVHGSHWSRSGLDKLLAKVGPGLTSLGLIAVKGMEVTSVRDVLSHCHQLDTLVLNSCDFEGLQQMDREHLEPAPVLQTLEEIIITSNTRASFVEWLLKAGPCVKVVHLGSTAQVTDETFHRLCVEGHLASMEEIQIERSDSLSLETLNTFLCHCPNIRSVGDISNWGGVSGSEVGEMRTICHEQNLALDLSSHQVLRRFLGMTGEDRRTMVTLMTGPVLERLRMAQEDARIRGGDGVEDI